MVFNQQIFVLLFVVHILTIIGFIVLKKIRVTERLRSSDIHPANLGKTALQLGGIIVVPLILAVSIFMTNYLEIISIKLQILIILPFILLFFTGVLDDFQPIRAPVRLIIHIINTTTIVIAIYQLTNFSGLSIFTENLGIIVPSIFMIIATTWMINTTNFIDGMDLFLVFSILPGCTLAVLHHYITGSDIMLSFIFSIFISALLGFAWFNIPKASIYMGDSGTLCIGLLLGSYGAFMLAKYGSIAGFMPFAYILVDATFTLLNRFKKNMYVFKSHNQHAYQIARRMGKTENSIRLHCLSASVLNTIFAYLCFKMNHEILWQVFFGIAAFLVSSIVFFMLKKQPSDI